MSYLVSTLKTDLEGIGHGTSINDIVAPDSLINRAARQVLADCDPPETKRILELTNGIYDSVYRYVSPSDLKGDKIIDIRPQTSRTLDDNMYQTRSQEFDLRKALITGQCSIEFDDATKYLRISHSFASSKSILLNECESLTANGTWSAAGGATGLASDTIYYVNGGASLSFNTGASGGYIENSDMTAQDVSNHVGVGSEFVWLYIPSSAAVSAVTGVALRWGSSSSTYYSNSVTNNFDSTSFHVGWNLLQFPWSSATATGSPTSTAYNYLRLTVTTNASVTGFRVDSFYSRLPSIYEVVYYSKFLFRSSGGTFQETVDDDTNIINLDTDSYNLLVGQCALLAAQQRGGKDAAPDVVFWSQRYQEDLKRYRTMYPSEAIVPRNTYYRISD